MGAFANRDSSKAGERNSKGDRMEEITSRNETISYQHHARAADSARFPGQVLIVDAADGRFGYRFID